MRNSVNIPSHNRVASGKPPIHAFVNFSNDYEDKDSSGFLIVVVAAELPFVI